MPFRACNTDPHLVKKLHRKFELRGDTAADRAEAKRWCSQFMRDAVAACQPLAL